MFLVYLKKISHTLLVFILDYTRIKLQPTKEYGLICHFGEAIINRPTVIN